MTPEEQIAELRRRVEALPRDDSRRLNARQHLRAAEDAIRVVRWARRTAIVESGERFGTSATIG